MSNHTPDAKVDERPWQRDIDRVQQAMREMLRVIAGLSGVELPGLTPGLQDEGMPAPRFDIKTLKDRICNELEGFSIKTTEELAKRAKDQTQVALDAIQNEVKDRVDQIAAEIREDLQRRLEPEDIEMDISKVGKDQIEKFLESSVEEGVARLEGSFRQKFENLFAKQEQMVQDRLQEALRSVQAQISTLEQAVQQICELRADLLAQPTAEGPNAAVDDKTKESGIRFDNNEGDGIPAKATSRLEWSFNLLETQKKQPAQITTAGLEEQREPAAPNNVDIHSRFQRARELLAGLNREPKLKG